MTDDENQPRKKVEPIKLQIGKRNAEEKIITYQIKNKEPPAEFRSKIKKP
jgi:hypothetical protein